MFEQIKDLEVFENISLKNFCTFKIGGNARILVIAKSVNALVEAVRICIKNNLRYKVIGCGSNLLFDDMGFDGVVVVNRSNQIVNEGEFLEADSGININYLCQYMCKLGYAGLEFAYGIPSSLGGAVVNNMGAFGGEIANVVHSVKIFDTDKIVELDNKDCQFSYRNSVFLNKNYTILTVKLKKIHAQIELLKEKMLENLRKKTSSQPTDIPSAGSAFKRLSNFLPARAIDEMHLKGAQVGDAMVSTKHSGFIVNVGNATSKDVLSLIEMIQEKIFFHYGIMLKPEIEHVNK